MDRYKTILLFGAPGSGKGTQGKIIGTIPGFLHSSTGDIFRSLDLASHYMHMYATLSMGGSGQSHKNVDESRSWLMKQYYSNNVRLSAEISRRKAYANNSNRRFFSPCAS